MNVIEFIGFIISFVAFIVLVFKRFFEKPKVYDRQEIEDKEQRLRRFLKDLDVEMDEDEEKYSPPPPPPSVPKISMQVKPTLKKVGALENRQLTTHIEQRKLETSIEDRFSGKSMVSQHYLDLVKTDAVLVNRRGPSRGSELIKHLKSKKDIVILQEIISKPLSLR